MVNATQTSLQPYSDADIEIGAWWFPCPRCGAQPGERCDMGILRKHSIPTEYHAGRVDRAAKARRLARIGGDDRAETYISRVGGRACAEPEPDPRMRLTGRRRLTTVQVKAELDRIEIIGDEAQPPYGPGATVYRCYGRPVADSSAELIYVGKAYAGFVRSRLRDHARKQWWSLVHVVVLTPFDFYLHAEAAEVDAIKAERPLVNVAHTMPEATS